MATNVFGQGAIQTAYVNYAKFNLDNPNPPYSTQGSLTLIWPSTYIDTPYTNPSTLINYDVLAASMNVTVNTSTSQSITLPDATMSSVGYNFIITNSATAAFSVKDSSGFTLITIPTTTNANSYWIQLIDNSTAKGQWLIVTYGAGTSSAQASALAGNGLVALSGISNATLNTDIQAKNLQTNYTVQLIDRAKLLIWTGGTGTLTLPAYNPIPTTPLGFYISINNQGSGILTINVPSSDTGKVLINGSDLSNTSQQLLFGQSIILALGNPPVNSPPPGINAIWWSLGYGQTHPTTAQETNVTILTGTNTLTPYQVTFGILNLIGTPTGAPTLQFPQGTVGYWYVLNSTTVTINLKTANSLIPVIPVVAGSVINVFSTGNDLYQPVTIPTFTGGSAASPSVSFTGTTTGLYGTTNLLGFSANGISPATVTPNALNIINGKSLIINDSTNATTTTLASTLASSTITLSSNSGTQLAISNTANLSNLSFGSQILNAPAIVISSPTVNTSPATINYNGITALTIAPTGAVTLNANSVIPIVSGGTGQTTKTAAFDALSPMTTGGDLIIGGNNGSGQRLGIGLVGQVLTVLSSGTLAWQPGNTGSYAPSAGSYITQTSIAGVTGNQALSTLSNGLLKNTTGGILAIAIPGTDYYNSTSVIPISSGGTGQTNASAAFNALSPIATVGDLIMGNGINSATRLPIGANGTSLTSNGSSAVWAYAGLVWSTVTGSLTMVSGNGYMANGVSNLDFTLPSPLTVGQQFAVINVGSGFTIKPSGLQRIQFGSVITTTSTGVLASTNVGDSVYLVCASPTLLVVQSVVGNLSYT